jgi:hypothetical protein
VVEQPAPPQRGGVAEHGARARVEHCGRVFVIVTPINALMARRAKEDPDTKECPECTSAIPVNARRCPLCTSQLAIAAEQ